MFAIVRKKSHTQLARQELNQSVEHFRQAATHAARGTGASVGPRINAARDRVQPAAGRVKGAASSGWGSAVAVLAPLAAAATDAARQADKQSKKAGKQAVRAKADAKSAKNMKKLQKSTDKALGRKDKSRGKFRGLLVVGAVVGAGAAFVLRRRQREQWDEYDPSRPIGASDQAGNESALTGGMPAGDAAFTPASSTTTPAAYAADVTTTQQPQIGRDVDIDDAKEDQTSSSMHSPTVARMASGTKES